MMKNSKKDRIDMTSRNQISEFKMDVKIPQSQNADVEFMQVDVFHGYVCTNCNIKKHYFIFENRNLSYDNLFLL